MSNVFVTRAAQPYLRSLLLTNPLPMQRNCMHSSMTALARREAGRCCLRPPTVPVLVHQRGGCLTSPSRRRGAESSTCWRPRQADRPQAGSTSQGQHASSYTAPAGRGAGRVEGGRNAARCMQQAGAGRPPTGAHLRCAACIKGSATLRRPTQQHCLLSLWISSISHSPPSWGSSIPAAQQAPAAALHSHVRIHGHSRTAAPLHQCSMG